MRTLKQLINKMPFLIKFYWASMVLFYFIATIPILIDVKIWHLPLYDLALVYTITFIFLIFIIALMDIILIQEAYKIKENIIEKAFRIYPLREKIVICTIAGVLIIGSLFAHNFLSSHYPNEPKNIRDTYGIYDSDYKLKKQLTKTEFVNYYRLNALIMTTIGFFFSLTQYIFFQTKKQIILDNKR